VASTQGIRAGRAFVELFADDSKLVRGLRRAERKLRAFGGSIRNFGLKIAGAIGVAVAPLGALTIRAAADAQESLSRFEQVFKDQAEAAGAFADEVAKSVGRSKIAIRDALATFQSFFVGLGFDSGKSRELSQTLQTLALDFASFNNLSDDEAIQRFIAALSGSGEVLDRFGVNIKQAALQQELLRMGVRKSWTEVTEQEKALARLNIIMRSMGDQGAVGDAVRTAGTFTNQMKRLRGRVRDAAVEIGQALLPIVTPLVAKVAEAAKQFGEWIRQNQQWVVTAFSVAAAAIAVGVAIAALGTAILGFTTIFGALITVITTAVAALKVMIAALAFLFTPIGLVVAAVAALGGALLHVTGAGAEALEWLSGQFEALEATAIAAWRGIADALAAGDIALAVKILWLTIKMEWTRGVNFLEKAWLSFRNFFIKIGRDAWSGLLAAAEIALHALEVGWIETTAFFAKAWQGFVGFFAKTWERIKAGALKAWNWIKSLFDDSVDLETENKLVEEQKQAAIDRIDDDRRRKLAQQEARRQRADRRHEATLAAIGQGNLDARNDLDAEFASRMAENDRELAEAREAWREALAEAKGKRAAADAARRAGEEAGDPDAPAPDPATLEPAFEFDPGSIPGLGDIGAKISEQAEKIGVTGTFNVAAAFGLGAGSSIEERTARASEETAKNTRNILDTVQRGGLEFA